MRGGSISERLDATGTANALELRGVSKLFGALAAMADINLTVRPGERRAVLGLERGWQDDAVQLRDGGFPRVLRHHPLLSARTSPRFRTAGAHSPRALRRTYQISACCSPG